MKTQKKEKAYTLFKKWYQFAKPSTRLFMITLLTALIPCVFAILEPIAAANVITSLTKSNYTDATIWLIAGFAFLFCGYASWHINYWNYSKLLGDVYVKLNLKVYDKIINSKDSNFKITSKEKILNTIGSDISTVGDFSDKISTKTSYFLRMIITLVIIFVSSVWAGIIVVGISILNFFLLRILNKKIATSSREVSESKDVIFEKMTSITDGRYFLSDFGLKQKAKDVYRKSCEKYVQSKHKNVMQYSYIDNGIFVLWKFIVMLLSVYLIWMVEGGAISLTVYLIIVSYVASGIDITNRFYMIFNDLEIATVSRIRIETILNFTEKELVQYGKNLDDNIEGNVSFIQVSVKPGIHNDPSIKQIDNISFNINKGELVLFYGQRSCGKRTIFHILRRALKPDSGKVMLGGSDLFEYAPAVSKSNIVYTTHKPFFFDGSLMNNLNMVEKSKKKCIEVCKMVGVHDHIMQLKDQYKTDMNKHSDLFSEKQNYLLGFARALLTNAEVIMLYEFPTQLTVKERLEIVELLKTFKGDRTLIVFAASEECLDASTSAYKMEQGKLAKTK